MTDLQIRIAYLDWKILRAEIRRHVRQGTPTRMRKKSR